MDTGQSPEAVGVEDREPQPVLSIRANVRVAQLTQAQGESLQALWSFMERRGVTPAGPPYVRYHTLGQTEADLEIGIRSPRPSPRRVGPRRASFRAAPRSPPGTSGRTMAWPTRTAAWSPGCKLNGREADGAAWEVYWWIDPAWSQTPQPGPRRQSGARSWSNRSSDPADQRGQADAE